MKRLISAILFISPLSAEVRLPEVLQEIRPGATWNLRGDDYEGLEWLEKEQTKPTREEIDLAISILESAEPMPSLQEQIDALLEGGQSASQMKERIQRARNKEPKK